MTRADEPDRSNAPGLDPCVVDRILTELGSAGERVLRCLRTAHSLLELGAVDAEGFRYAASAAYNVREALDSVVRDRPAGEGGLTAALEAWEQYRLSCDLPGGDEPTARAVLTETFDELARDRQRQAYTTRQLLNWFQQQTGVTPIPGADDPTREYQRLRRTASSMVHDEASRVAARALLDDAVAWFARFFAPPSDIVNRIEQLAAVPFSTERLVELRGVAMNSHHLRLFLERVEDANWLEPMRVVGLIGLPSAAEAWPVTALTGESHRLADGAVAELLWRLVDELSSIPTQERPACAFEIARAASWLGPAGHPIVIELLRRFRTVDWLQAIAMSVSRKLDATDPCQVAIADAVIGSEPRSDRSYRSRELVTRLVDGLTEQNVHERFSLIAMKLRRVAAEQRYPYLDIVALPAEGVDESEHVLDMAQRLAAAIPKSRVLGMSSSSMLRQVARVAGELGERLTCQILAGADDIDRKRKLSHLAIRFTSPTATGDDRALLDDLLPLADNELAVLQGAFGTPPLAPLESDKLDNSWARAWRWSMLLPPSVLARWDDAIATVTSVHGRPDQSAMARRTPAAGAQFGSSPITADDLAALDPVEAASLIAAWRPSSTDPWGVSARELARTLETLVRDAPEAWTGDPVAVVQTLREPVYIDHYFRAVKASTAKTVKSAPTLIRAIQSVRRERWRPASLGRNDYEFEDDWTTVDSVSAELVAALAEANADLDDDLGLCWQLVIELTQDLPTDLGSADEYLDTSRHDDPLHRAINSTHGQGLRAVLALGGWEHRNKGAASDRLASALSSALAVDGAVGLQFRAVIAASRPFLETIVPDWIEHNHQVLFDDELGQITLDQTLKYSQPTKVFYDLSLERLLGAARRGARHAVAWLLIAYLRDETGYSYDSIVGGLAGRDSALCELSRELARLSTDVPEQQMTVTERGLRFWQQLLADAGGHVPTASLEGLGRWALDRNLNPTTWVKMTEQTLTLTNGAIEFAAEVAERCRDIQPSMPGLRVLAALLGHGDRWEQHHIDSIGVEALQAAANVGITDNSFNLLRERLIQRGRHDASSLTVDRREH